MVTLTLAILGNRLAKTATLTAAGAFLLVSVTSADARGHRAHLSADLQKHLDAGDSGPSTVILSGTSDQIALIAARHSLRIRRLLANGAVVDVPAGALDALAADADVPQVSGDHVTQGQMSVTDTSIGADQVWTGVGLGAGFNRPITGRHVGVAVLDSGITIVGELRGQVRARVDMIDPKGTVRMSGVMARTSPASSPARELSKATAAASRPMRTWWV